MRANVTSSAMLRFDVHFDDYFCETEGGKSIEQGYSNIVCTLIYNEQLLLAQVGNLTVEPSSAVRRRHGSRWTIRAERATPTAG